MAKTINTGYSDTPIDGVDSLEFPRGLLNLAADFRVKSNTNKEVILTNLTSPIDRPENIRFSYSEVSNIYSGAGIEPSLASPSKGGVSVLVQLTEILSVADDTDPEYRVDLPLACHLVIKAPKSEHITASVVQAAIGRLLSGLFDTGSTSGTRLESILRGSLIPKEM